MAFLSYDATFLDHDTGIGHLERSDRLTASTDHLRECGLSGRLRSLPPRRAQRVEIELAHTSRHVDQVARASERSASLDPDTPTSPASYGAALLAAGATLAAADEVMGGEEGRGFCLVRPPGHHAGSEGAMGFCLFNNLAVCARYLRSEYRVPKVAIIDFDVHHGNGTEEILGDDPHVFYLSLHRYPFYPGTGGPFPPRRHSVAVRNIPLPAETPPAEYHRAFRAGLEEVSRFAPDVVLVSAGFDAHRLDPIGGLGLGEADFGLLTRQIVALAERTAKGRIISALEGGYNLTTLGPCLEEHLRALDG